MFAGRRLQPLITRLVPILKYDHLVCVGRSTHNGCPTSSLLLRHSSLHRVDLILSMSWQIRRK